MNEAFITLLSSEDYLDGALVLHESYKEHNPKYPFVIATTENVATSKTIKIIEKSGAICEVIPSCKYNSYVEEYWKNNSVLNTASKYSLFDLKQYDKLVYIDADTYIVTDINCLMDYPDGAMIFNPNYEKTGGDKYGFTGAYVFKPKNHETNFYKVLSENLNMVDGELIGKMWFFVMDSPSHQIPVSYCCGYDWWTHNKETPVNILHFSGKNKPWLTQFPEINDHIRNYYRLLKKIQGYKEFFSWKPLPNLFTFKKEI